MGVAKERQIELQETVLEEIERQIEALNKVKHRVESEDLTEEELKAAMSSILRQ